MLVRQAEQQSGLCRYGVASRDADAFEKACEQHVFAEALAKAKARGEIREADFASKVHSVLLEKTTMFSPEVLVNAGASLSSFLTTRDSSLCGHRSTSIAIMPQHGRRISLPHMLGSTCPAHGMALRKRWGSLTASVKKGAGCGIVHCNA